MKIWTAIDRFIKWLGRPREPWFEHGEITFDGVTFRAIKIRYMGVFFQRPDQSWRKIGRRWIELLFKPTEQ